MAVLTSSYHLDEALPGLPIDGTALRVELPEGTRLARMAALYDVVAGEVATRTRTGEVVVLASGDCSTSLGVLAGLQRAGIDPGVVWFDAHGDFNTAASTTSGYLGGMPLAMAVGLDDLGLAAAVGLTSLDPARVVLTDARDLDPAERELLDGSLVRRLQVAEVTAASVPDGQLYLHVDLDVIDAAEAPGLLYPVGGGATRADVVAAVGRVLATGRVAAIGLACTFEPDALQSDLVRELVGSLGLPQA